MEKDVLEKKLSDTLYSLEKEPSVDFFLKLEKSMSEINSQAIVSPSPRRVLLSRTAIISAIAAMFAIGVFALNYLISSFQPVELEVLAQDTGFIVPMEETQIAQELILTDPAKPTDIPEQTVKPKPIIAQNVPEITHQETPTAQIYSSNTPQNQTSDKFIEAPKQELSHAPVSISQQKQSSEPPKKTLAEVLREERLKVKYKRLAFSLFAAPLVGQQINNYTNTTQIASIIGSGNTSEKLLSMANGENSDAAFKHTVPSSVGLNFIYTLYPNLSVESGVMFTYFSSECSSKDSSVNYSFKQKSHYLGVPLAVKYNFTHSDVLRVYSSIGIMAEVGLWGSNTVNYTSVSTSQQKTATEKIEYKGVQPSINVGAGIEYRFVPGMGVYFEPTLNFYPKISSSPISFLTKNALFLGLKAGFRIKIK